MVQGSLDLTDFSSGCRRCFLKNTNDIALQNKDNCVVEVRLPQFPFKPQLPVITYASCRVGIIWAVDYVFRISWRRYCSESVVDKVAFAFTPFLIRLNYQLFEAFEIVAEGEMLCCHVQYFELILDPWQCDRDRIPKPV